MISYPDACPTCQPGMSDTALPVGDPAETTAGCLASYECGTCGTAWTTWFDRYGWPIERAIAPVRSAA